MMMMMMIMVMLIETMMKMRRGRKVKLLYIFSGHNILVIDS